jgi:hypothetical protein
MFIRPIKESTNEIKFDLKNVCIREHLHTPTGNIYCMFALLPEEKAIGHRFVIDERLKGFGTHVVFINNSRAFSERLSAAINRAKIPAKASIVSNEDFSTYVGSKTYFMKDIQYSHQSEYRIFLDTASTKECILSLGNLEDIACMYPLGSFNQRLIDQIGPTK